VLFAGMGTSKIPARFTEKLDLEREFDFSDYNLPKVLEVSEKLARAAVLRAGGKIEKDPQGKEVFLIPKQTPKPGKAEQCLTPGPVANSKFTEEEMKQIVAPVKK
jgi:hypothetical protein